MVAFDFSLSEAAEVFLSNESYTVHLYIHLLPWCCLWKHLKFYMSKTKALGSAIDL